MSQLNLDLTSPVGCCELCGAKVVEYKFGLNKGHVAFLYKLAKFGDPAHIDDLGLTNSQYGNYSMTRRWGLSEQLPAANEIERRKGGKWCLTPLGCDFLQGVALVPKYVHTKKNVLTRTSGPQVGVLDIDETYLYKGDFRAQAAGQLGGKS